MEALFDRATSFNGDMSMWDVSSVTTMQKEELSIKQPALRVIFQTGMYTMLQQ